MSKRDWTTFQKGDYPSLRGDERALTLAVFRGASPALSGWFNDDQLLEAFGDLINADLIEISFKLGKRGAFGRIDFPKGSDSKTAASILGVTLQ